MDKLDKKKATSTAKHATKKGALDSEDTDAKKGGKSDKLKDGLSKSNNPTNDITIRQCREAFKARYAKISEEYDNRAKRSGWTNKDGSVKDDGSKARFLQTMPDYCYKAIIESRIAIDYSNKEYKLNPAFAFYDQYINENYTYSKQRVKKVKKNYVSKGASAIVNGQDVLNAFGLWKQIGRDEGNFVTSLKEDIALFKKQGIDLQKLQDKTVSSSSAINDSKAKNVALAKGLPVYKFNTGMYQYVYSPDFIRNANCKTKYDGDKTLSTANGDMLGANPLNLPGMMTWVESKDKTERLNNGTAKTTASADNIENSESELMVPTIKLQPADCFNFSENIFADDTELKKMNSLLVNGISAINTSECFIIDKDGAKVFSGSIKGNVKVQVLQPAKPDTSTNWTDYQVKEAKRKREEKEAEEAAKLATSSPATTTK